jgi:cytochrome c551/c552
MRRARLIYLLASIVAVVLYGCGAKSESPSSSEPTPAPASTPAPETTPAATTSPYDAGPRAGESPVDAALAAQGEKLFQTKGCMVCHGFGKKVTCPDLVGVSMRRTATWMEHQILHPDVMVKEDPISRELRKGFPLEMTNLKLTQAEARAVIEFLKRKDRDAGVKKPG